MLTFLPVFANALDIAAKMLAMAAKLTAQFVAFYLLISNYS